MVRKTATLDPVKVCMLALRQIKSASDYHAIGNTNPNEILTAAWNTLSEVDQQRITNIINNDTPATPQTIADELTACGAKLQLAAIKAQHGQLAVKQAWKLLSVEERSRLTTICQNESTEELEPVEKPATYKVESESKLTKRNLIELTSDLQQLDDLLDNLNGEDITAELQHAVDELLQERAATNEAMMEKLDNYCALIQSRLMWVAARRSEAERMAKLAESDTKVVDFLRSRLKSHLEAIGEKKLRTKRFNISVCANGGKTPLRFDDTTPELMPERFQRVTVEPNREAIRSALDQGDVRARQSRRARTSPAH